MTGSKGHPDSELPRREEWDFRARGLTAWYDERQYGPFDFLDEDGAYYCNCWEIDRSEADRPIVLKSRQALPEWQAWQQAMGKSPPISGQDKEALREKTFDALLEHHLRTSPYKMVLANWFYLPWPEWPDEPYLSVPRSERNRRFKASWKDAPRLTLRLVKLKDICDDIRDFREGKTPRRLRCWQANYALTLDFDVWIYSQRFGEEAKQAPCEITAFEIDYNLTDKYLLRLFSNWLRARRKEKGYKEQETRGPASPTVRMRKELCALGAARLISAGMTCEEAIQYTKKLTGKPLYADKAAWSRANYLGRRWV